MIDPTDNNIVFVAATGSLWGAGGERGVYKTTDGGATWKQVLKGPNDWTGANDLVMAKTDRNIMYASLYQRQRSQCCFNGGGPGSAHLQVHGPRRDVDASSRRFRRATWAASRWTCSAAARISFTR